MKKLSKGQLQDKMNLSERLHAAESNLSIAIADFNAGVGKMFANVEDATNALNEVRGEVASYRDDVVGDMESYAGDRSEKWQESDAAALHSEWQSEWESLDCEEVSIDPPDDLEEPEWAADSFDALPEEVSA